MPIPPRLNPYAVTIAPGLAITSVTSDSPQEISVTGRDLDTLDSMRFVGTSGLDLSIYNPDGPNAGFNNPPISVIFTPTLITISSIDPGLSGDIINEAHARDEGFNDLLVVDGLSTEIQ